MLLTRSEANSSGALDSGVGIYSPNSVAVDSSKLPSSPYSLEPQQKSLPASLTAQTCSPPIATDAMRSASSSEDARASPNQKGRLFGDNGVLKGARPAER